MKSTEYVQQQAERLISNPDFQADVLALRRTLALPDKGFASNDLAEAWKQEHWYDRWYDDEHDPQAPTNKAIADIVYKYSLPAGWHHSIQRYLFINDPNDMQLPTQLRVNIINDEDTGLPEIHIIIAEHTTIEDLKKEWKRVKQLQKKLPYNTQSRRPAYLQKIAKAAYEMTEQSPKLAWPDIHLKIKDDFNYKQDLPDLQDLVKKYRRRVRVSNKPK